MNIYFLVEGKTEAKIYPKWLEHLLPELKRVNQAIEVEKNSFYLLNSGGFPSILEDLKKSVEDINNIDKFNYLVVSLDADELTIKERRKEIFDFIEKESIELNTNTELVLIIQKVCIETWLLGNRKVFKKNPQNKDLMEFIKFYDVSQNDPEEMGSLYEDETKAQFHERYLKAMLSERNIKYSKTRPRDTMDKNYLEELIKRIEETQDIQTFSSFIDFCERVKREF